MNYDKLLLMYTNNDNMDTPHICGLSSNTIVNICMIRGKEKQYHLTSVHQKSS